MKEEYYGKTLLKLYYKSQLDKLDEERRKEMKDLEDNDELLQEVRQLEDYFETALESIRNKFHENNKYNIINPSIPHDFFEIDLNSYFNNYEDIVEKYNKKIKELNSKVELIKGHLVMTSNMTEALDVLYKFKIVDKKTGNIKID